VDPIGSDHHQPAEAASKAIEKALYTVVVLQIGRRQYYNESQH
jgi:hypothetical protein